MNIMTDNKNIDKLSNSLSCNVEQTARILRVSAFRFFEETENIPVSFNDFLIIETLFANPKIHQRDLAKLLFRGTIGIMICLVSWYVFLSTIRTVHSLIWKFSATVSTIFCHFNPFTQTILTKYKIYF